MALHIPPVANRKMTVFLGVLVSVCFNTAGLLGQVSEIDTSEVFDQAIRGSIRDTTTGLPVHNAQVAMVDASGDTVITVLSGEDGSFMAAAPGWGTFVISILRLGYEPVVRPPMRLRTGDTLDIVYHMQPLAFPMSPFVVVADAQTRYAHVRFLQTEGFYRRERTLPSGRWLDPAWIDRHRNFVHRMADYLVGLPHVQRLDGARARNGRRIRLRCGAPYLWVDGNRVFGGGLDQAVDPTDVLAIEIYDGEIVSSPIYKGCSIVVWTRRRAETR